MKKVLIIESDRYLSKFKKFLDEVNEHMGVNFFEDACTFLQTNRVDRT